MSNDILKLVSCLHEEAVESMYFVLNYRRWVPRPPIDLLYKFNLQNLPVIEII